ncbi:hypothetical protein L248_2111 [Schleiferilactobacillus shenzhenensis LY-73]|uniref:Uncharacterized protein n=1 Tax=Schleiferilactobacillus shenzhenensis LY-73 TaxID=1231336 RepID=U4TPL6_9LACO|nr:hypothetical protein L248_2111 [Schleiferilactobacillus shenzhenensis LY-73]
MIRTVQTLMTEKAGITIVVSLPLSPAMAAVNRTNSEKA